MEEKLSNICQAKDWRPVDYEWVLGSSSDFQDCFYILHTCSLI